MSYTELESGYQDLKQANRPGFYVGHDGNVITLGRPMGNSWDKLSYRAKEERIQSRIRRLMNFNRMPHVYSSPNLSESLHLPTMDLRSSSFSYGSKECSYSDSFGVGANLSVPSMQFRDFVQGDIDMCGDQNDGMDSDCSVSSNSGKQVIVGICAMSKKTQSKPMKEILTRLQEFEYIKMVVFSEDVILKESVENWPICDCLISFHSKGFPLEKAIHYAQLRNPYVINNLHMQFDIQDRRRVYAILQGEGIEIPRYAVLDRDSPDPNLYELIESEDHVEVNGIVFNKPFVEKPVSAEDHNIYIYYPTSAGGGSQRLFRKIGSRSSVYSPESRVRKTGSFIYEDFMPTDGTDVKVYTVGPDYAHAEARKSPALDGKVERDSEGKEIRYPVILNNAEKLISRKVCLAFKQTVCGFDLLRANGKSYVCDVNGFSFVKNSNKYYDDCAKILGNMILRELTPTLHIPWSVPFQLDDPPIVPTTFGKMMELRCVVAVIRHGDRTPKQKMKVEVRHQKFFEIFEKYDGYKHGHVKLKKPKQLQEILDIARALLTEIQTKAAESEIEEKQGKLEQLKNVLEMYGHFSGINRKVQMKYQPKGRPRGSSSDDGNNSSGNVPKEPSLVLILKWGGELTPAGRIQAEELGRIFRCMYPGGQGRNDYSGAQGLGLLRLHSTFRHDLKIYASDEGRVQMTAAAFAKGLLALEGELTPILVQMVKSANTNGLLDNDCDSSKYQNIAKIRLHELMQIDREFTSEDREAINPGNSISISQAMDFVKNPVQCCNHVQALIQTLLQIITIKKDDPKTKDAILYHGETWDLMLRRWGKIEKDFSTKNKTFDISKIPDIYDCIKYDLQHNQHTLQYEQAEELYLYAKNLADIVIPQEYGLTLQEKLAIGQGICTPLLKKIKADLQRNIEEVGDESVNRLNPRYSHGVSSPGRHVRTRLYFTSESHVHSLLTVLRFGGLLNVLTDEQWRRAMEYISMVSELNYMSQVVIMLYEDPTKDPSSEERFHVELHFSPGVNCCVQKNLPPGPGFRPHSRNDSSQSKNITPEDKNPTRIDEENDLNLEESPLSESKNLSEQVSSPEEQSEMCDLPKPQRPRHLKSSKPIPIGSHHTVSGHEAMDLAKRLSEELASQQTKQPSSFDNKTRPLSPETEPRSRSYEQRQPKTKDSYIMATKLETSKSLSKVNISSSTPLYDINSATNELPLSAIDFSTSTLTPEIQMLDPLDDRNHISSSLSASYLSQYIIEPIARISPSATNERPLSCTCLATIGVGSNEDLSVLADSSDLHKRRFSITTCVDDHSSRHRKNVCTALVNSHTDRENVVFLSADNIYKLSNNNRISNSQQQTIVDIYHLSCSAPALISYDNIDRKTTFHNSYCKLRSKSHYNSCPMSLLSRNSSNRSLADDNIINPYSSCCSCNDITSILKPKSKSQSHLLSPIERQKTETLLFAESVQSLPQLQLHTEMQLEYSIEKSIEMQLPMKREQKLQLSQQKLQPQLYLVSPVQLQSQSLFTRSQSQLEVRVQTPTTINNLEMQSQSQSQSRTQFDSVLFETSSIKRRIRRSPYKRLIKAPSMLPLSQSYNKKDINRLYKINNPKNNNNRLLINKNFKLPIINITNVTNANDASSSVCSTMPNSVNVPIHVSVAMPKPIPEFVSVASSNSNANSIANTHTCTNATITSCCPITTSSTTNLCPITKPHPQNEKLLHDPDNTTSSASSSTSTSARRQRHSIAGQMSYFKMLGFGGFGKKMATSTNSLFSTAVISGSSSAPNLRDMIPSAATPSVLEGFGGVPTIRPLETLHNALSLKQLDAFLEKMTTAPLFKTPASSPPKYPSTPVPTPTQTPQNCLPERPTTLSSWSKQSSVSSVGYLSSAGPSSPVVSDSYSRDYSSSEMSASLASTDGSNVLPRSEELSKYFPILDEDLNSVCKQLVLEDSDVFRSRQIDSDAKLEDDSCSTPVVVGSDFTTDAPRKGSTTTVAGSSDLVGEDEDEATLSGEPACISIMAEDTLSVEDPKTTTGHCTACIDLNTLTSQLLSVTSKSEQCLETIRSPSRNRVKKQISLYENELVSASEFKLISHVSPKRISLQDRKFGTLDSSFLTQSASNDSLKSNRSGPNKTTENTKTMSCLNLKTCISHHPGAIVVKELFIDPPKRVTRSFHGKSTSVHTSEFRTLDDDALNVGGINSQKLRFFATKITDPKDNK